MDIEGGGAADTVLSEQEAGVVIWDEFTETGSEGVSGLVGGGRTTKGGDGL